MPHLTPAVTTRPVQVLYKFLPNNDIAESVLVFPVVIARRHKVAISEIPNEAQFFDDRSDVRPQYVAVGELDDLFDGLLQLHIIRFNHTRELIETRERMLQITKPAGTRGKAQAIATPID